MGPQRLAHHVRRTIGRQSTLDLGSRFQVPSSRFWFQVPVPGSGSGFRVPGSAFQVLMARFKLFIEYAGTKYSGWQIQKNARTVQGEITRVVGEVTRQTQFELYGSGRTDAGVHALEQVAHLDIITSMPAETLRRRVNDALPSDIHLLKIELAHRKFHARHDAVSRSYLYQIARRRTAFAKHFVWWVRDDLDLAKMRAAADQFCGMKDFRSFTDDSADEKSTVVGIERIDVAEDG